MEKKKNKAMKKILVAAAITAVAGAAVIIYLRSKAEKKLEELAEQDDFLDEDEHKNMFDYAYNYIG